MITPCQFCGYEFDQETLGIYGCANCYGDGLDGDLAEQRNQILEEIRGIQDARRTNWPSPDGPTNAALEDEHTNRIQALRRKINTLDKH